LICESRMRRIRIRGRENRRKIIKSKGVKGGGTG
jgi:hypothetical protein